MAAGQPSGSAGDFPDRRETIALATLDSDGLPHAATPYYRRGVIAPP